MEKEAASAYGYDMGKQSHAASSSSGEVARRKTRRVRDGQCTTSKKSVAQGTPRESREEDAASVYCSTLSTQSGPCPVVALAAPAAPAAGASSFAGPTCARPTV
jgi:hypothetical protein